MRRLVLKGGGGEIPDKDTYLYHIDSPLHCLISYFRRCFSDGQSSIERVVQNRLSNISEDVGSTVSQWTMSAAIGHLRNYVAGVTESGESDLEVFNQFVVHPEASSSRRLARQRRIEQRRNGT